MNADDYPAPDGMPDDVAAVWREVVDAHAAVGDDTIARKLGRLEAYASVKAIHRSATARASKYGDTVQDARGAPIRNPAVDIVADMNRELARWGDTFEPKPPRAPRGGRGRTIGA